MLYNRFVAQHCAVLLLRCIVIVAVKLLLCNCSIVQCHMQLCWSMKACIHPNLIVPLFAPAAAAPASNAAAAAAPIENMAQGSTPTGIRIKDR